MKLTKRGLQVLYAVHTIQHDTQQLVTGPQLLALFAKSTLDPEAGQVSVEGLHQSAATLVRKGLLRKFIASPVSYEMTDAGRAELANRLDKQGRPL